MTDFLFKNNAIGSLAADINSLASSLSLGVGEGAAFPNPTAGQAFRMTLQAGSAYEIVEVTARSGDTMTISRAKEGTTAQAWVAGTSVQLRVTAGVLEALRDGKTANAAIGALTPAADRFPYFTGSSAAALAVLTAFARTVLATATAADARTALGLGNTGISAGAYVLPNVTVDVLGRITTITAGDANSIETLLDAASKTFPPDDASVTFAKLAAALVGDAAAYRAATANKALMADQVWAAAAPVSVPYAASVALDMATGINFSIGAATGNLVLANPTNVKPGQSGYIVTTQDGTGGRSITFGSNYKFVDGAVPTPDTVAGRTNIYTYVALATNSLWVTMARGVR